MTIFKITCLFFMFMIIIFRFNVINENNLMLINLKYKLEVANSNLATTQMNVDQSTNLAKIEAYAKQKLGMQKPGKNQVVYIDTSKNTSVVNKIDQNLFEKVIESIKEYINKLK